MTRPVDQRTNAELVSDALNLVTALFRSEIQLAKAEVAQKAKTAAMGLGLVAGGGILSVATLVMVLFTVAALLADAGLSTGVATLIATLLGAAATSGLIWAGLQRLKGEALVPERIMRQIRRDAAVAKEQTR